MIVVLCVYDENDIVYDSPYRDPAWSNPAGIIGFVPAPLHAIYRRQRKATPAVGEHRDRHDDRMTVRLCCLVAN